MNGTWNAELFGPGDGKRIVRVDDVKKYPRYGKSAPLGGTPVGHLPVTSYLAVPVVSRFGQVLFSHPHPVVLDRGVEVAT